MTLSWGLLLSVAQVVWVVLIATFIVLERRSPTATLAWITTVAARSPYRRDPPASRPLRHGSFRNLEQQGHVARAE